MTSDITRSALERLYEQLRAAQGLLLDEGSAGRRWDEASGLLQRVDQALGTLVLETDNLAMASRLLAVRSILSGHLRAAATLAELVEPPSPAGVEALRRAAEKTRAGLEAMVLPA